MPFTCYLTTLLMLLPSTFRNTTTTDFANEQISTENKRQHTCHGFLNEQIHVYSKHPYTLVSILNALVYQEHIFGE